MIRYFIGFILTIGLIIFLIVLLVGGGGGSKPKTSKSTDKLYSYANTDAQTRLTIDGVTNYQGDHERVQISVSRTDVSYDQLQGYDGQVIKNQTLPNTQKAFEAFLQTLGHLGFTKGDTNPALADERGFCPTGQRYVFEVINGAQTVQRYWATSCGGTKTYLGNLQDTLTVFQKQVSGYENLTSNLHGL